MLLQFCLLSSWSLHSLLFTLMSSLSCQKNTDKSATIQHKTHTEQLTPQEVKLLPYYCHFYCSYIFMYRAIYEYFCGIFKKANSNSANIFPKSEFKWFQRLSSETVISQWDQMWASNNYKSITIKTFNHFCHSSSISLGLSTDIFPCTADSVFLSVKLIKQVCLFELLLNFCSSQLICCEEALHKQLHYLLSIAIALWGQ